MKKSCKKVKKKDIRQHIFNCDRCGQKHKIDIDFRSLSKAQLEGSEPVLTNFICPNIALMYRVMNFALDTRVSIFKQKNLKKEQEETASHFKAEWGELDFNAKLSRFINLDLSFIGVPEEYYNLLTPVIYSYCCGYYYPAMTSAGSLGERIINRLILKTRDYYKSSKHYKKVWSKKSFEQWDLPINVLVEWKIISDKVAGLLLRLKKYRNDSIHYKDDYNFELNAHDAIKVLAEIIDCQFNYIKRKDLFWVFNIPGEIWVKSEVADDPFVKEFILPHCLQLTPFCEPTAKPPIRGKNVPLKPLSDEEFIKIRNNRKRK